MQELEDVSDPGEAHCGYMSILPKQISKKNILDISSLNRYFKK